MNSVDKWDKSHSQIPKNKSVSNYAIEKESLFPKNSQVLDLGGGTGVDAVYFAKRGHNVVLADISPTALDLASKKAGVEQASIETILVDLTKRKLPFKTSSFDVVYSRLALHYFDKQTTLDIFIEINRVLKLGGACYLTLKSPSDKRETKFLRQHAKEIENGLYLENGNIKSRYTSKQLRGILSKINNIEGSVKDYQESLGGRVDKVKSGNQSLLLNEVIWTKL